MVYQYFFQHPCSSIHLKSPTKNIAHPGKLKIWVPLTLWSRKPFAPINPVLRSDPTSTAQGWLKGRLGVAQIPDSASYPLICPDGVLTGLLIFKLGIFPLPRVALQIRQVV